MIVMVFIIVLHALLGISFMLFFFRNQIDPVKIITTLSPNTTTKKA